MKTPTHGALHATIARHFVDHGTAPTIAQLSRRLALDRETVSNALQALAEYHGVVLHPTSGEIWAMHPFSAEPTSFWVEIHGRGWWGNCAWCSLGIAALLHADATITTTLRGESEQVVLRIPDAALARADHRVHFPIPMARAWDDVTYTCSTILVFASDAAVDAWCVRHAMPRGDVQSLAAVWAFAQAWYGRHLDPAWTKWTTDEARALFARFGLTGPTWELPATAERFRGGAVTIGRVLEAGGCLIAGAPRRLVLRSGDAFLVPFSLLMVGFAIFLETSVLEGDAPPLTASILSAVPVLAAMGQDVSGARVQ